MSGDIRFELKLDVGPREFHSADELDEWCKNEMEEFQWLETAHKNENQLSSTKNCIFGLLSRIAQFATALRTENETAIPKREEAITLFLKTTYGDKNPITSTSPRAIFARQLVETHSHVIAGYALAAFLNIDFQPNPLSRAMIMGYSLAATFLEKIDATKSGLEESLASMQSTWSEKFYQTDVKLANELDKARQEVTKAAEKSDEQSRNAQSQLEEQQQQFEKQLADAQDKWHELEELYNKQLALQAPVKYWQEKKKSHLIWMIGAIMITSIFAYITVEGFLHYCGTAYKSDPKIVGFVFSGLNFKNIGMLIVISTFGIWLVRLGSKIFVSNLHLRTDAIERGTMVQTYLALLKEDDGMSEDARNLMLQSIFRPATSGMVKDEGPINIIEMAGHAVSKKAGG